MNDFIIEFAENIVVNNVILSFLFFFISHSLQILFPPYPGDMVLILEGYLIELANLNIFLVVANAVLATFLSSLLLYHIGKVEEEKILHLRIIKIFFETKRIEKLRRLFERFGPIVIIFSKFIPGIFSITVLASGIFKVRKRYAYVGILLVTTLHHTVLITLGKMLGENWNILFKKMNVYNKYIIIALVIAFIIYGLLLLIKKRFL